MPDEFLLKSVIFKLISKEISRAEHEYMNTPPPPPPINPLAMAPLLNRLGVKLDENLLNWDSHIEIVCKKTSAAIGAIRRIKPFEKVFCSHTLIIAPPLGHLQLW